MSEGIIFNKRTARAIEDIVLRMMASDPMRRKPPKRIPRPATGKFLGVLGIAVMDIDGCKRLTSSAASGRDPEDYDLIDERPSDSPVFTFGSGKVQIVEPADMAGGISVRGAYEGNQPLTETWYNMVPAKVHRGQLLQGKRFPLNGRYITIVDVEPCD